VVVAVGPRRDVVGREVERRFGPRVHVLDDGFQHLRLHRDLDVVCAAARDLGDRPLPAGFLREPRTALARADVLLMAREGWDEQAHGAILSSIGAPRVHFVSRRVVAFTDADARRTEAPARAYLLSGVARPERFAADVAAAGSTVVGHARFRDHHPFTERELDGVWADAVKHDATAVVTTAKDLVRLPARGRALPLVVLEIEAAVEQADVLLARLRAVAAGDRA
jgi:tetraacyldisaccharide 4'-kinase